VAESCLQGLSTREIQDVVFKFGLESIWTRIKIEIQGSKNCGNFGTLPFDLEMLILRICRDLLDEELIYLFNHYNMNQNCLMQKGGSSI
jgi:hypothetical protein